MSTGYSKFSKISSLLTPLKCSHLLIYCVSSVKDTLASSMFNTHDFCVTHMIFASEVSCKCLPVLGGEIKNAFMREGL